MPDLAAGHWYVDVEKMLQGEYWTNRYVVAAPDLETAHNNGQSIASLERIIHHTSVLFVKVRTSDGKKDTDVYTVSNLNFFGNRASLSTLLPLFNVARVDLDTAGGGRPSRKYLRGILCEQDVDFNTVHADIITLINDSYADALAAMPGVVDVDGQDIINGSVYPFVGMRQLRRGSKRKAAGTGDTVPL